MTDQHNHNLHFVRQDETADYVVIVVTLSPDGIDVLNPNDLTDEELSETFYTLSQVFEE